MSTHHLIFDYDGVLADTYQAVVKARIQIGKNSTEEEAVQDVANHVNSRPFHQTRVLTPEDWRAEQNWMDMFGKAVMSNGFSLFEEFIQEIAKIHSARLAVVSSGSKHYVVDPLVQTSLSFTHILTFEDHHSKEEKVQQVCSDWGVLVQDILYFTDTQTDVFELEKLMPKSHIIGCAWGFSGYAKLSEVLPESQILREFKDIHALLR